jgi:hypothetical protein
VLFPVYRTPRRKNSKPEVLAGSGESSCLYHQEYKASSICHSCGAFICQLCEIHLQADPICPACLERQTQGGKSGILKKKHYLWDNLSLALALFVPASVMLWFMSLFTAPCALFLACRFWNDTGGLRRISRLRLSLAIVLSLLQLAGWVLLFLYAFNSFSKLPTSH